MSKIVSFRISTDQRPTAAWTASMSRLRMLAQQREVMLEVEGRPPERLLDAKPELRQLTLVGIQQALECATEGQSVHVFFADDDRTIEIEVSTENSEAKPLFSSDLVAACNASTRSYRCPQGGQTWAIIYRRPNHLLRVA